MTWQPAAILYPDAELLVTTGLQALLVTEGETDVHVGRSVPTPREDRMVIVTRDGGAHGELRDRPRLRIRVWDKKQQAADDLARLVAALVYRLAANGTILRAEHESGPYEVADESKKPQRYLLFTVHTRGEALA